MNEIKSPFWRAAAAFFIFGPETGLFSTIGLAAKSLVIDDVIQNLNLCK